MTLLGVSLLVTGCINTGEVKTPKSTQSFEPKRAYDTSVSKVWKAANDTLDENRISVVSSDQAAGRIQTDTVAGDNYISVLGGGTMTRYSYNIRVTGEEGGKTKLFVICKYESMHQVGSSTRPYMMSGQNIRIKLKITKIGYTSKSRKSFRSVSGQNTELIK